MSKFANSRLAVLIIILLLFGLLVVACGTRADSPRPTFEPTATYDFAVRGDTGQDVAQPATDVAEPTEIPQPTPTMNVTEVVPTEVPPTEIPTEMPTEVPQDVLTGDPELGEQLFRFLPNPETQQMCVTCHNPDEPAPGVGPYLYGIANRAGERVEGQSAEEYLRTSIVQPEAFIAPPQEGGPEAWPENVMPQNWGEVLTEEEINSLVAFLMTLDQTE